MQFDDVSGEEEMHVGTEEQTGDGGPGDDDTST